MHNAGQETLLLLILTARGVQQQCRYTCAPVSFRAVSSLLKKLFYLFAVILFAFFVIFSVSIYAVPDEQTRT